MGRRRGKGSERETETEEGYDGEREGKEKGRAQIREKGERTDASQHTECC